MKKSKPISHLVKQVLPELDDPPCDADTQQRLQHYWQSESGIIAPYTRPFIYQSGRLVIFCDSPTWANQVRHQVPSLIRQFREQGFSVFEITIRNTPESKPPQSKQRTYHNSLSLSDKNATALKNLSKGIKHKRLQDSLKKLAEKAS